MHMLADAHDTLHSAVARAPFGGGVCKTVHRLPSQDSASAAADLWRAPDAPTASQLLDAAQDTLANPYPSLLFSFGVGSLLHCPLESAWAGTTVARATTGPNSPSRHHLR
jgi:hypothetical protein